MEIYDSLLGAVCDEYDRVTLIKKSERGEVTLIRHRASGNRYIFRHFSGSSEVYRKLLTVSCPNLPQIMEVGEKEGKTALLEEYVQGDTLGEILQGGLLTAAQAKQITRQLCMALWVLHSLGVVHRDVKPDNVIIRGTEAVLIDFDASRIYKNENREDTQIHGTTGFAAPEQYEGKINAATDIYTFGKTLSVLCKKTDYLLFIRNMSLFWLIFRCCMKKPGIRYQNMQTVQKKLNRIQKRQNQSKIKNMLVLSGSSIVFAVIVVFLLFSSNFVSGSKPFNFYEELTAVTDLYYQEEFQNGSKADQEKICKQADTRLRELQKQCTEKEESRKILQLLAVNSEYQKSYEDAGLYFEQMLFYDETYRAGYGEYGMFLLRTGQQEASQTLWSEYKSKETMLDDTVSRNLRLWEKEMTEIEEKQ